MDSYAATSDVMVNADDRGDGYYDDRVRELYGNRLFELW